MKSFIKMTLAVVTGMIIMSVLFLFVFIGILGALMTSSSSAVISDNSVLVIDMSKINIEEKQNEESLTEMFKNKNLAEISIHDLIESIKKASSDPAISMIYLKPEGNTSLVHAEELRAALDNFRKSGKPVVSYIQTPKTSDYYLASVSDKIYVGEYAGTGGLIAGTMTKIYYLKDILDAFGVNIQLIRHGKYKSAGETFVRSTPSEENIVQNKELVNSIWDAVCESVCESRNISREKFNSLVESMEINKPEIMVKEGLADNYATNDKMEENIKVLTGNDKAPNYVALDKYIEAKKSELHKVKENSVAIIYADGEIVGGNDSKGIAGDRFAKMIEKIRKDDKIKAVVLRVSSPGGSVLASDIIKRELDLLKEKKPLIASYGYAAASGGYWISNHADRIFSNKTTITGSIGVFSMIPDFSKTIKNIKVNVATISSTKHSDMYSLSRPLDDKELEFMQNSVDKIYDAFVENVASGRNLTKEFVDSIAQGRVWTGSQALKLKLVDEIGTLEDAIEYAIGRTDIEKENLSIIEYPKPLSNMEKVLSMFNMDENADKALAKLPFYDVYRTFKDITMKSKDRIYARIPYEFELK